MQREACFATATCSDERHKAHIVTSKQLQESCHGPFSSDEPSGRGWQIVLEGVPRKVGASGGNGLSLFLCEGTKRRCLPFFGAKDARLQLSLFKQVERFVL